MIQYNHGDSADETALEQLHRRLGLERAVFFDAVAIEGRGVLQTLSALSKQVLALIRERSESATAIAEAPAAAPIAPPVAPVGAPAGEIEGGSRRAAPVTR